MSNINIDRSKTLLAAISCCDFVIINFVFYITFIVLGKDIPDYFHTYTRVVVVLTNVAILIGEIFFRTIVHVRLLRLIDVSVNVFRLTLTFTISLAVLLKAHLQQHAAALLAVFLPCLLRVSDSFAYLRA